jgi:beta-mannosidase
VRDGHQRLSGDDHYYSAGLRPYAEEAPEQPFRARFWSEIGVLSCPSLEELRLFLSEDELWPVDGKVWRYHATDTRLAGPGWGNVEAIRRWITTNGLPEPQNISEFVAASQEVQARALVDWFWRMAKDPECGGMLIFVYGDNWPQVNLSVVGYPCAPKPAYWALREAFQENLRLQRERRKGGVP